MLTTAGMFIVAVDIAAQNTRSVGIAAQTTALGAVAQTIADQGASIQDPAADPVTQGV